jgi:hypothetical protein
MNAATRRTLSFIAAAGAGALSLANTGCTGLEPAVLGAAVSGAQSGVTLLADHELWSYELASFEDVSAAVDTTALRLELERANERREEDRYWVFFRDDRGRKVVIQVRPRTASVTSIEIDVQSPADRGMASLFLRQVFFELREMGAYPAWFFEHQYGPTDAAEDTPVSNSLLHAS